MSVNGLHPWGVAPWGVSLTDESTENPFLGLIDDPTANLTWLVIATPKDPSDDSVQTIRWSNNGYTSKPGDSVRAHYRKVLISAYKASYTLSGVGELGSSLDSSIASLKVADPNGDFVTELGYSWAGCDVEVWVGLDSWSFSQFTRILKATVSDQPTYDLNSITVPLESSQAFLQKPVQTQKYEGRGAAIRTDGDGDYVLVGNHPSTLLYGDLDIQFKARFYSTPADDVGVAGFGVMSGSTESENFLWAIKIDVDNNRLQLRHEYGAGTAWTKSSAGSIPSSYFSDGEWHTYRVVRNDGDKEVSFYVDGEDAGLGGGGGSYEGEDPTGGTDGVLMLCRTYAPSLDAEGDFDDFRIWNRVLDDDEIASYEGRELAGNEDGLVAYYDLNEGGLTTTTDKVSRTTSKGISTRKAFALKGTDSFTTSHDSALIPSKTGFTFGAWVHLATLPSTGLGVILEKANGYNLNVGSDGQLNVGVWDGASFTGVETPTGLYSAASGWLHVVGTLNSSTNRIYLYVNGELAANTSLPGMSIFSSGDFTIGNTAGSGHDSWIAEAFLLDDELSAEEIADLYSNGVSILDPLLVAKWGFTEQTGTTAGDEVGSNDLTTTTPTGDWVSTDGELQGDTDWVGSLEGGPSLAGKYVPANFGHIFEFEPVPVDPQRLVFQVHDGAISAILDVKDKGDPLTFDQDVTDIYSVTPSSGEYTTDLSRGLIRLGTSPTGILTVNFRGDASGSGFVETCAEIMERLVEDRGEVSSIDSALINAAAVEQPAPVGVSSRTEAVSIESMLNTLAVTMGGWWGFDRTGLFGVEVIVDPDVAPKVATITEEDVVLGGCKVYDLIDPAWDFSVGYQRHERTLNADQVAVTVDEDERQALGEEFRYALRTFAATKETWERAREVRINSTFALEKDAHVELRRRFVLNSVPRKLARIELKADILKFFPGQYVGIDIKTNDISRIAGSFLLFGLSEDDESGNAILFLWGG